MYNYILLVIFCLFSSNDLSPIEENTLHNYSRYQCVKQYSDEYYPASDVNPSNNHYIYVTYPPEIKRKLLDRYIDICILLINKMHQYFNVKVKLIFFYSCYNRTPRL